MASVASIERAAFSDPWSEGDFEECVTTGVPFLVAVAGKSVLGYAIAHHAVDEGEILNLGVAPDQRRRGIGRALIGTMLSRLRDSGVRTVYLEVRESNAPARSLYASLGFAAVGRRSGYYRLPREDAVILRTQLDRSERRA